MEISNELFEKIVIRAWRLGRGWGETYQGWFIPSPTEHKVRRKEVIEKCHLLLTNSTQIPNTSTKLPVMTIQCPSCNSPKHDMVIIIRKDNSPIIKCRECGTTFDLDCAWESEDSK